MWGTHAHKTDAILGTAMAYRDTPSTLLPSRLGSDIRTPAPSPPFLLPSGFHAFPPPPSSDASPPGPSTRGGLQNGTADASFLVTFFAATDKYRASVDHKAQALRNLEHELHEAAKTYAAAAGVPHDRSQRHHQHRHSHHHSSHHRRGHRSSSRDGERRRKGKDGDAKRRRKRDSKERQSKETDAPAVDAPSAANAPPAADAAPSNPNPPVAVSTSSSNTAAPAPPGASPSPNRNGGSFRQELIELPSAQGPLSPSVIRRPGRSQSLIVPGSGVVSSVSALDQKTQSSSFFGEGLFRAVSRRASFNDAIPEGAQFTRQRSGSLLSVLGSRSRSGSLVARSRSGSLVSAIGLVPSSRPRSGSLMSSTGSLHAGEEDGGTMVRKQSVFHSMLSKVGGSMRRNSACNALPLTAGGALPAFRHEVDGSIARHPPQAVVTAGAVPLPVVDVPTASRDVERALAVHAPSPRRAPQEDAKRSGSTGSHAGSAKSRASSHSGADSRTRRGGSGARQSQPRQQHERGAGHRRTRPSKEGRGEVAL